MQKDDRLKAAAAVVAEALQKGLAQTSQVQEHIDELSCVSPSVFFRIQKKVSEYEADENTDWFKQSLKLAVD